MKKLNRLLFSLLLSCFMMGTMESKGQFSLSGQVRTRSELRNGTGTLKPSGNKAAFFTSQRSRLIFDYKSERVIFHTSLQDVRVWGQDASTISNADGARLSLHEAWAELLVANNKDSAFKKSIFTYAGIRVGRQELLYDDSRLLGNLDWLQQARRHDAVVFKFIIKDLQLDAGAAFNQNTDAFNYNGTTYTPANLPAFVKDTRGNLVPLPAGIVPLANSQGISAKSGTPVFMNAPGTNALNQNYKSLQFVYAAKKINKSKISALLVADQFGKYKLDSVTTVAGTDTGYIYGRRYNQAGVNGRFTTGLLAASPIGKAWLLEAGAYYQGGKDKEGLDISAYTTTAALTLTGKKTAYTAGWDLLSGNNAFSGASTNHRFDPLYGTPHKFWGQMDYFYAGTGSPAGGLSNMYFKIKYISAGKNLSVGLDYHYFSLANDQKDINGSPIKKYLGSEFDLIANYKLNKITNIELGLAYMAATKSMEYAKGIAPGTANLNGSWAYLQLNIKPDFFTK